jgi:CRP-like cAMP-binding protein
MTRGSLNGNEPDVRRTLAQSDPFSALGDEEAGRIAAASSFRALRRGEALWRRGEPSAAAAVTVKGHVKCWSAGRQRRQWVEDIHGPGEVCGLAACVDRGPHSFNAEALERSLVLLVPADAIEVALQRDPPFARRVGWKLACELRRVGGVCEDVALRTPTERLARHLWMRSSGSRDFDLHETQSELAGRLGTVREVVARSFRRLEAEGVIARSGRVVHVLRPDALSAACG